MRHASARPLLQLQNSDITPFSSVPAFPASMHPHAQVGQASRMKKCISVPDMVGRSRTLSDPLPPTRYPSSLRRRTPGLEGMGQGAGSIAQPPELRPRVKGIFHLSNPPSDNEDEPDSPESRQRSLDDDAGLHESWSDLPQEQEQEKDAQRRFHALKELLLTEAHYVADLKVLVTVRLGTSIHKH